METDVASDGHRRSHHAARMDHVAPSTTHRDAPEDSRSRRRSISIDSNNKRTRLNATNDSNDAPIQQMQYTSSHAPPPSSYTPSTGFPVAYFTDSSSNSGYVASRTVDHHPQNPQHFISSILHPPKPHNPPSEAPPSSWGSQAHSTSFPSPPLASPIVGSPFPRRDSAYSNGNQRPSSPSAASSSSSSRGDNARPPYPPIRAYDQASSSYGTPTPTFSTVPQPQLHNSSTNGFIAPFPPAHRASSSTDSGVYNGGYNPAGLPYVADRHTSIAQAAAQNATNATQPPYLGPEPRSLYAGDAVYRHFQQDVTHNNYSQTHTELPRGTFSPAFGAWARPLQNNASPSQTPSQVPSRAASSMPSPAAPLHNILHPVDQSPVIKHAEVTSRSEMERHTPSSAAHGFPAHAPVNTPPAVPSSVAANAAPSLPPSEPSSTVVGDSPTTAPSAAKEVLIAPKTGNEIQIVPPASAEEVARDQQRSQRRWRSNFSVDQRNETSQTRAIGACLRCKSQRVRCVPSPLGPFHTCLTCEQVSKNSKKVLHEIRCVRWRMVAVTTYRSGGLNLTRRWEGTTVQDVGDWTEIKTHEIEMKLFYSSHMHRYDLCDIPIKFRVRGFKPVEGDVLTRKWIKRIKLPDGRTVTEKRYIQLPAYALADANATVEIFRQYFETNAINAMLNVAKHSHPIIGRHLEAAVAHCQSLPDGDVEKIFMQKFIKMWFCVRFTTGSDYISGPNKLGCLPVPDSDYPLGDKISVPRMITAQGDSIMVSRFLRPLTQDLIPEFEKIFRIGNPDNWFLLYISTFILLSEISFSCQDRRRHAQENWLKQKYTLPEFVGELQFGANIILCYWHYYRTMDPMDDGWDIFCKIIEPPVKPRAEIESAKGKGKKKVHLTRSQHALVTSHWRDMVEISTMMDTPEYRECFEHPLYFVCQMYMKGWQIRDHYKRGPQDEPQETI